MFSWFPVHFLEHHKVTGGVIASCAKFVLNFVFLFVFFLHFFTDEFERRRRIEHHFDAFSDEKYWGGGSTDGDAEGSITENTSILKVNSVTDAEHPDLYGDSSCGTIEYANSDLSYRESEDRLSLNLRKTVSWEMMELRNGHVQTTTGPMDPGVASVN